MTELAEQIKTLGLAKRPNETGGIIIPLPDTPPHQWVIELTNISTEPRDTCLFDLMELEEGHREELMLTKDPSRVWLWHTHPAGNIGPSKMDLNARLPGVNYIVVSLPDGIATRY